MRIWTYRNIIFFKSSKFAKNQIRGHLEDLHRAFNISKIEENLFLTATPPVTLIILDLMFVLKQLNWWTKIFHET